MNTTARGFEFERLDAYHATVEFYDVARKIIKGLPYDYREEKDQFRRAALSMMLNLCEATGEFSKKEHARFLRMSLRSTCECAGLVKLFIHDFGDERKDLQAANDILLRIVAMLTGLIRHNLPLKRPASKPKP